MSPRAFGLSAGALIALVIAAAGGYWFGVHRPSQSATPASTPKADSQTGRKILYWHDPMVPGAKFDKPGKSPFMDMPLVPMFGDQTADDARVSISPRTVQNLGIRTVVVSEGQMGQGVETVGAVAIDERTISAVQSRVNGYIVKLYVRAQYDPVSSGQPLVDIYAPEWLSAQEEYLTLKRATQPGADVLADAARERLALLGVSEPQIRRLEETGQPSAHVTLYAPESGLVWELGTRDGSAVSAGMTLFKLASLKSVWVNAEIPETQTAQVMPGARVVTRAAAFPDKTFNGRVSLILPDVNAVTRTIKARIEIDNPQRLLKPGMFARLEFGSHDQRRLMVPTEAIIYTGKRSVVIVAEGDGKFHPVEVVTGSDRDDMTEIRKGLQAGQKVVASGQFLIDSEASLTGVLARMNDPNAAQTAEGAQK